MEAKEYCDSMTAELSGWKSKLDHIVGNFDRAPSDDKKRVIDEVKEVHRITDELGRRIEGLKRECVRDFSRGK